jgi:hypothetical protein
MISSIPMAPNMSSSYLVPLDDVSFSKSSEVSHNNREELVDMKYLWLDWIMKWFIHLPSTILWAKMRR